MERDTETSVELKIIRSRRDWKLRFLMRLFPRQFNQFANAHLSRAKELMIIDSYALHDLAHYVGADLYLPGHGGLPPWYRRDSYGWPIETIQGRPVHNFIRIVLQNIRKVTR